MTRAFVGSLFLTLALSAAAVAQHPASPDSAQRDSLSLHLLPPVIVTGTFVPLPQSHLGFASSVLARQDLQSEPTSYAGRALTRLPGVWIDEGAGPAGPTVIRLRGGEEPYTQVLFDGVPININGGFLDMQGLTLTNVDRAEVARGPHSVMYGSSAMAGVVQFITRRGEQGPPRMELSAESGRATAYGEQARSELNVGGGTANLQYSAGLGVTYNRGVYQLPHKLRTGDASLRLDTQLSQAWTATGTVRYMDIDSRLPVRDAGVTRVPLDPNQRDGRDRLLSSLGITFAATPSWHHRLTASSFRDDFTYSDQADGLDPTQYPFFVFDVNFGYRSLLHREVVQYAGTKQLGDREGSGLALSYGGELQREAETDDQTGDFGDSRQAFDRSSRAAFTEIQGQLGARLSLQAGGRLEQIEGLASEFLPRGALTAMLVPGVLSVRAAAGRAFKAPNLQQQLLVNPFTEANPDLRPETSVSWEVGTAVTVPGNGLQANLGFFRQRYDNLIRTVALEGTPKQTNRNLGRSRSQGVEIDVQRWWTDRWHTGANLTWLKTEILDNTGLSADQYPNGSELPAVPRVTGSAFIDGALSRTLSATVRGTLVGRQVVFSERFAGDRIPLDPYGLLGMTVRWQASDHATFHLRVENILDTDYATAFDRPGLPLTAILGVRLTN